MMLSIKTASSDGCSFTPLFSSCPVYDVRLTSCKYTNLIIIVYSRKT
nr:MAG TPA: hypothetical protein [Caudoviricetes sp.]